MGPFDPGQDIFRTTADQRFNSFTDPGRMNSSQMNSGNWGMDPNQLTPSYTAAYRPSYNGSQGNPFGMPQPTFWQSVNPFPLGRPNYGEICTNNNLHILIL